jgi:hypothetical protein
LWRHIPPSLPIIVAGKVARTKTTNIDETLEF